MNDLQDPQEDHNKPVIGSLTWIELVALAIFAWIVFMLMMGCSTPETTRPYGPGATYYAAGISPVCTHFAAQTSFGRKYDIVVHAEDCDRGPRCMYYTMGVRVTSVGEEVHDGE